MPRKAGKVPSYCHHKASGQAVVRIDDQDFYLGLYGSPESHERYERRLAEWRSGQTKKRDQQAANGLVQVDLTVNKLMLAYDDFISSYYVKEGKATNEQKEIRAALRPMRRLYGSTPAKDFGPKALKAVRDQMVTDGLSRGVVNARVNRIKRFVKWAVSEELVPPALYHGLQAVRGLIFGRTEARETEPVRPVPDAWVDATLPYVSPQVAAMIRLQRLTGMRPCEVVLLRACDIDMSAEVWVYEPHDHKNRWRGLRRLVPLGPRAQDIVRQFLKLDTQAYLFSPTEAEAQRNELRRQGRKTRMTPSQAKRKRKARPERPKRTRYDTNSYRRAIYYGIRKAGRAGVPIPHWYPLQLRHSHATRVRREHGIEAAQVALGHARADVTQIYAERNLALATKIAQECG